jgi:hypothetical protein
VADDFDGVEEEMPMEIRAVPVMISIDDLATQPKLSNQWKNMEPK